MGIVVSMSEPSIDLALYGDKSNFLQGYLSNQMQSLGTNLNEFGQKIQNAIQTSYNFVTDTMTQYGLRNELSQAGLDVLDNYYKELTDWVALQEANATMQRWIMTNPTVKQLYIDQNLDGYSGEYQSVSDNEGVGVDDYNYRRVMDGMVDTSKEDDTWVVNHFYEDLLPGDRELEHFEKCAILTSWSASDYMLANCDWDFTCKSEEPVKINK